MNEAPPTSKESIDIDAPGLTELEAAQLYLRMVNELEPEPFIARLSPKVRYVSHWVLEELDNADAVARLLREKIRHERQAGKRDQHARLGVATTYEQGRPLALIYENDRAAATVDFTIEEGRIAHIGIMILGAHEPQFLSDENLPKFLAHYPTSHYAKRKSRSG